MLLIEKIETLGYTTEIKQNHCSIIESKQNDTFLDFDGFFISSAGLNAASKMEAVWKTIIAFIKSHRP